MTPKPAYTTGELDNAYARALGRGTAYLETECVGDCPHRYRIDEQHPEFEIVKAALDRGDRSVIRCYHRRRT